MESIGHERHFAAAGAADFDQIEQILNPKSTFLKKTRLKITLVLTHVTSLYQIEGKTLKSQIIGL
jgi:hypothetical protein